MIKKISREKLVEISNASAKILPDNPTGRGMTADEIRKRLWEPIVSKGNSLAEEIDRVAGEANTDIAAAIAKAEDELSDALHEARQGLETAIDARVERKTVGTGKQSLYGVYDGGDRLYDLEIEETGAWSVPRRDRGGRLYAGSPLKNETIVHPERQVVTLGYLEKQQEETVAPRLTALEAAVAGKTRSYAIKDAQALTELLSGYWRNGSETHVAEELRMGDNVFVIDAGIPDFWFEETTDQSRAEEITLEVNGEVRRIPLVVYGYDNGGVTVGLLHAIEGEKTQIDFSWVDEQIGDIEAALDAILDMQERLIGGEGA